MKEEKLCVCVCVCVNVFTIPHPLAPHQNPLSVSILWQQTATMSYHNREEDNIQEKGYHLAVFTESHHDGRIFFFTKKHIFYFYALRLKWRITKGVVAQRLHMFLRKREAQGKAG